MALPVLRFMYTQECPLCDKRFKMFKAVKKHAEQKHQEQVRANLNGIQFWVNEEHVAALWNIKAIERRTTDYKEGYLP